MAEGKASGGGGISTKEYMGIWWRRVIQAKGSEGTNSRAEGVRGICRGRRRKSRCRGCEGHGDLNWRDAAKGVLWEGPRGC